MHPAPEFREGLGPRLPPPRHQGDAVLDRGAAAPPTTAARRGVAGHAPQRVTHGAQHHARLRLTAVPLGRSSHRRSASADLIVQSLSSRRRCRVGSLSVCTRNFETVLVVLDVDTAFVGR